MYAKLHAGRLGITGGILWGLTIFILSWIARSTGYARYWLSLWTDIYPGFDFSIEGIFLGLVYAFVDGFISLFLIAWIYNLMRPKQT